MKITYPDSNHIIWELDSPLEVHDNWEFFVEGLQELNRINSKINITREELFQQCCRIISLKQDGAVILLLSKNRKPLAFGLGFKAIDFSLNPCFAVWAAYSNSKDKNAMKTMLAYAESRARELGLKTIKAASARINQAAMRLFERNWGFRRETIQFAKAL